MLGDSYLKIDGIDVPNPKSFKRNFDNIETANQSEAGTDLVTVKRLQKLKIEMTFNCSSFWANRLKTFCNETSSTLTVANVSKTGRLRLVGEELVENSERVVNTDGLWRLTISFTEV